MTATDFASLGLSEPVLLALRARNYATPTPIQARSIPHLLQGRDLLGIAQTGTGKTAAFSLPMLDLLVASGHRPRSRMPRALVLAPTRELALQVTDALRDFAKKLPVRVVTVYGGAAYGPQLQALRAETELSLRDKFSAQAYHDFILAQGLLPPAVLHKSVMDDFVAPKLKATAAN